MSRTPKTPPRYESRAVAYAVSCLGKSLLDEMTTRVEIDDEGAGEFIVIIQTEDETARVKIDPEEWPLIRAAVDALMESRR